LVDNLIAKINNVSRLNGKGGHMAGYRVVVSLLILALAGCASVPPERGRAQDLAAIEAFNKAYLKAINDGDADTLISLTVDDHIMMMPNQPIVAGKARLDAASRRMAEQFRIQETWQPVETVIDGRLAYQRGTFSTTITPKSGGPGRTTEGKFLRIYRRQDDGKWTMVIDSFSSDRPQ
jgi:ketosteroid isomerase-like protein